MPGRIKAPFGYLLARQYADKRVARELLRFRAPLEMSSHPNEPNAFGEMPLVSVMKTGEIVAIMTLLDAGADPNYSAQLGPGRRATSALDFARKRRKYHYFVPLLEAYAKSGVPVLTIKPALYSGLFG